MSANSINSISEFLLHAGTEYQVFDLGRRLEPTDSQTFLEIENGSAYAPYPRQQLEYWVYFPTLTTSRTRRARNLW